MDEVRVEGCTMPLVLRVAPSHELNILSSDQAQTRSGSSVAGRDVPLPGCSTGQPAMAQEVHYIRQHGVDGVRRSPEEKSMHFYSRFYDRSERAGAGDVVEKSRILSGGARALSA